MTGAAVIWKGTLKTLSVIETSGCFYLAIVWFKRILFWCPQVKQLASYLDKVRGGKKDKKEKKEKHKKEKKHRHKDRRADSSEDDAPPAKRQRSL